MIYCASMGNSIAQFITVTLIFIFVLAITYFTTRWIGSYQKKKMSYGNIKVIESTRLSSNKILEIVKAGDKCVLIAVCKDTVTYLGEINENTLEFKEAQTKESFGSVFNRFRFSGKEEAEDEEEK
ncbi:MAG: flagellar biosynthetic protein FliO [Lachnospiraceae bacterium]|nr:flagellar biosynthetic protein FliO [Lachnospiraceae bacterium]